VITIKRKIIGSKVIHKKECPSTNTLAIELLQDQLLPEGTVIIADHQSHGRGQQGTTWESAPNKNITLSVVLYPTFLKAKDHFLLNMTISLAVQQFLQSHFVDPIQLKWPNDLYYHDKKLGGILIENTIGVDSTIKYSVIGIGLNVNQTAFTISSAISMAQISQKTFQLSSLIEELLNSLEEKYLALKAGKTSHLFSLYLQSLYAYKKKRSFRDKIGRFEGIIQDVTIDGKLKIVTQNGEIRYFLPKEVTLLK